MSASDICNEILLARDVGWVRCGIVEGSLGLVDAARAFKLAENEATYRSIKKQEADAIAIDILHASLAYRSYVIMSLACATELWRRFMDQFQGHEVRRFTNAGEPITMTGGDTRPWSPATESTFDMGILILGETKAGCLWVEEED